MLKIMFRRLKSSMKRAFSSTCRYLSELPCRYRIWRISRTIETQDAVARPEGWNISSSAIAKAIDGLPPDGKKLIDEVGHVHDTINIGHKDTRVVLGNGDEIRVIGKHKPPQLTSYAMNRPEQESSDPYAGVR